MQSLRSRKPSESQAKAARPRQNTLRKLQMNNRVQLTRWAIEHGLDEDD